MRKILPILLSLAVSLAVVTVEYYTRTETYANSSVQSIQEPSLIAQAILSVEESTHRIIKVYQQKQLIGILDADADVDGFLKTAYATRYATDFPETKLGFGEDIFLSEEESYVRYENRDNEIFDYIESNDLFSVEVDKIEFSNGAVIFVKNIELFEEAKELYLGNFISENAYNLILNNQLPPALTTYGYREVGFSIVETATYQKGLAPSSKILKTLSDIVYFLSYGYGTEIETYTVEEYDTVEGVAYKAGLSPQQVVTINNEQLKTITQILEVGSVLNVTYFNSPINVIVTRERLAKETVYPQSTLYVKDPTMQEGYSVIQTREENGYKNVMYEETYVNGEVTNATILSSTIIKYPVREVIRIGTKVVSGVGSGSLRWPLGADSHASCRWYCYGGHQGLDLVYNYNKNGPIYAADRGVVSRAGYDWRNGYHIYINHNNGMKTLYAHMIRRPAVSVGDKVEKGDFVGNVGSTGRSTGAHLHFGVYVDGVAKNPCNYLDGC